jgi:hypothetical protein
MIDGLHAIGVRFDIEKVGDAAYGVACWRAFWRAIPPSKLAGAVLFEGDTADSLDGIENVYCIAVQSFDSAVASLIKAAIADNAALRRICAAPPITEGSVCQREPLMEAARIDFAGQIVGHAWNARAGLSAISGSPGREA